MATSQNPPGLLFSTTVRKCAIVKYRREAFPGATFEQQVLKDEQLLRQDHPGQTRFCCQTGLTEGCGGGGVDGDTGNSSSGIALKNKQGLKFVTNSAY